MRFITALVYFSIWRLCNAASALNIVDCRTFGDNSHSFPNRLYMASLNVGTGECHLVRQGDSVVLFDAGHRKAPDKADHIVDCLVEMMSYTSDARREKAALEGIFITHGHDDHLNLIKSILDESRIELGEKFCIYFGGASTSSYKTLTRHLDDVEYSFISDFYTRCFEGRDFIIEGMNVSKVEETDEENPNDYGGVFFLDCFEKRRIAFLGDMSRFGFEMACSPVLYSGYQLYSKKTFPLERHSEKDRRFLYDKLSGADIFTAPHHGSLVSGEGVIYGALESAGKKGKRMCICSSSAVKQGTMPTIEPTLLYSFRGYSEVFEHNVTEKRRWKLK